MIFHCSAQTGQLLGGTKSAVMKVGMETRTRKRLWIHILVLDMKNHVSENLSRHQGTVNSSGLRTSETYRPQ